MTIAQAMAALEISMAESRRGLIVRLRQAGASPVRIALAMEEVRKAEDRTRTRTRARILAALAADGAA